MLLKSRKGRGFSAKQDQPNDNENIAVEEISKTDIAEISPNDEDILDIDDEDGVVRISLVHYNSLKDTNKIIDALEKI